MKIITAVILLVSLNAFADELPPEADIGAAVQKYIDKSATGGNKISEADQAVMQKAAEELARKMPDPGLKVGDKAPDFTLPDAFGKPVTLSDYYKNGPVVLSFYRGAWCPFCNIEMHALHASLPQFKKYGAELIAVSPQKPDKSKEQIKKDGYPFPVLSDLDDTVMKDYKLLFEVPEELHQVYLGLGLDITEYNGKDRLVLPVPATYVIDRNGIIRAAFADVDYKKRMEPKAIIEALKKL